MAAAPGRLCGQRHHTRCGFCSLKTNRARRRCWRRACASRPTPSTSSATAKRAVYQAAITEYDAIVLDVVLPLQDGLAVCRAHSTGRVGGSGADADRARRGGGAHRRAWTAARTTISRSLRFRRAAGAPPRHHSPRPAAANALDSSRRSPRTGHARPPRAPSRRAADADRAGVRAARASGPARQRGRRAAATLRSTCGMRRSKPCRT